MFTKNSRFKDIFASPVGSDLLHTLCVQTGFSAALVQNPVVSSMTLGMAQKLYPSKIDDAFVGVLLAMLNAGGQAEVLPAAVAKHIWWKESVVYQIYPRSFYDTNGDGIGDIPGITAKLPYLKELGVDVLWLSPIYDSPDDDNGYDIRDYQKIMEKFGTMADFTTLLHTAHQMGMKLIMDLVVNHTSDEHAWFKAAQTDANSPYHDYYIWQKGEKEKAPNNWNSFFSGGAWNYYENVGAWALHLFSKKQMDLNWENPAMRADVERMVRWWLDMGVDGFRLDVINFISKDSLADGSETLAKFISPRGIEHYFYGPKLHDYLRELRSESFGKYDVFTVGETPGVGIQMARQLTHESRGELDLVFNFDHLDAPGKNRYTPYCYDLHNLRSYFLHWQQHYGDGCWMSLFYNNHDNPRMLSKIEPSGAYHKELAKLLAAIQMTLKGTPFVYQGEELGMPNAAFNTVQDLRDIEAINRYHEKKASLGEAQAFAQSAHGTRDHARTPMPWSAGEQGGFTTGIPWIGMNESYPVINAEAQMAEEGSVFAFYKQVIALRHAHKALVYGSFVPMFTKQKKYRDLFCYFRVEGEEKFYIECNITHNEVKRAAPIVPRQHLCLSNYKQPSAFLRPYEVNIYRVD